MRLVAVHLTPFHTELDNFVSFIF